MQDEEAAAIIDSFHFIQLLRLRNQEDAMPRDAASGDVDTSRVSGAMAHPNRVNPDDLNALDRRILKEALRQARKLQSRLEMDFQT